MADAEGDKMVIRERTFPQQRDWKQQFLIKTEPGSAHGREPGSLSTQVHIKKRR